MKKLSLILSALVVLMIFSYVIVNMEEIAITGKYVMSTRLVIVTFGEGYCDIDFVQGWNLVSFPCLFADMSIPLLFSYYNGSYESVRQYRASDSNDPWKSYNPSLPSWVVHDVTTFARDKGYWIYIDNATNFFINASLATPTLMDLSPGWNMIGYPSRNVTYINYTYQQIIPNFDYVHIYNASDGDWKEWTWNTSLPSNQDLNYTHLYYGYWVYMLTSDTLVIS